VWNVVISFLVTNNTQHRLRMVEGGTLITFRYTEFGFIPDEVRKE